ncbi:MAG: TPM domain-containing protein [Pseudomonadota bacterium]|uniref:TPM domain-containing protein n=1 Tax=Polaromonas sp. TaxID=1869339 RepID=UPI0018195CDB|nr:TPM domain-containing protein [Polaromonas sp.]MBA3595402.1 TPM domain-containing protein [Polaromonas sp.]MDQ3270663.1 TPM domain-containing protein [Pseudomonadota bacterium]
MMNKLTLILRHLWLDASDAERVIPPDVLTRVTQRVAASERRHSGEIRICVEASLPLSYLARVGSLSPLPKAIRERAIAMFGKLGVWDTAQNNGVLIYVLLAEHAIEIVADRGLNTHVTPEQWKALVVQMGKAFREKRYEDGLTHGLEETSAVLMQHFALTPGQAFDNVNELPDAPQLQ